MPLLPPESHLHMCLGPWPLVGSRAAAALRAPPDDSSSQAADEGGPGSCSRGCSLWLRWPCWFMVSQMTLSQLPLLWWPCSLLSLQRLCPVKQCDS